MRYVIFIGNLIKTEVDIKYLNIFIESYILELLSRYMDLSGYSDSCFIRVTINDYIREVHPACGDSYVMKTLIDYPELNDYLFKDDFFSVSEALKPFFKRDISNLIINDRTSGFGAPMISNILITTSLIDSKVYLIELGTVRGF